MTGDFWKGFSAAGASTISLFPACVAETAWLAHADKFRKLGLTNSSVLACFAESLSIAHNGNRITFAIVGQTRKPIDRDISTPIILAHEHKPQSDS